MNIRNIEARTENETRAALERDLSTVRSFGRPATTSELEGVGVSRTALGRLVAEGLVERPVRGVYHVPSLHDDSRVVWAAAALGYDPVFCLMSAASWHGLTEESPGMLEMALPKGSRVPSEESFEARTRFRRFVEGGPDDVEIVDIQGVSVRVTSPARTVVDLFRFSPLNDRIHGTPLVTEPSFHEGLSRYLERFGADAALRECAGTFGVWDRLKDLCGFLQMTESRMTPH